MQDAPRKTLDMTSLPLFVSSRSAVQRHPNSRSSMHSSVVKCHQLAHDSGRSARQCPPNQRWTRRLFKVEIMQLSVRDMDRKTRSVITNRIRCDTCPLFYPARSGSEIKVEASTL